MTADNRAPAFPVAEDHRVADQFPWTQGMTLREYAAIHIAAAIAGRAVTFGTDRLAQESVALADAVIAEARK